jgi:hypothetical protein
MAALYAIRFDPEPLLDLASVELENLIYVFSPVGVFMG